MIKLNNWYVKKNNKKLYYQASSYSDEYGYELIEHVRIGNKLMETKNRESANDRDLTRFYMKFKSLRG